MPDGKKAEVVSEIATAIMFPFTKIGRELPANIAGYIKVSYKQVENGIRNILTKEAGLKNYLPATSAPGEVIVTRSAAAPSSSSSLSSSSMGCGSMSAMAESSAPAAKSAQAAETGMVEAAQAEAQVVARQAAKVPNTTLTFDQALDGINSNLTKYLDPSVGDLKLIEANIQRLKEFPGALTKDGPLVKLFQTGTIGSTPGNLRTACGAAYELEVALTVEQSGHKFIGFGKSGIVPAIGSDIDIQFENLWVECKNWQWQAVTPKALNKFKSALPHLNKTASDYKKQFILYSKNVIPQDIKQWLIDKNITFKEGLK